MFKLILVLSIAWVASATIMNDLETLVATFERANGIKDSVLSLADIFYFLSSIDRTQIDKATINSLDQLEENVRRKELIFVENFTSQQFWDSLESFQNYYLANEPTSFLRHWVDARRVKLDIHRDDPRKKVVGIYFLKSIKETLDRRLDPLIYIQAFFEGGGFCTFFKHPNDENNLIDKSDPSNENFSRFIFWLSRQDTDSNLFNLNAMQNLKFLFQVCKLLKEVSIEENKRKSILLYLLKHDPEKIPTLKPNQYTSLYYPTTSSQICEAFLNAEVKYLESRFSIETLLLFQHECLDDLLTFVDLNKGQEHWKRYNDLLIKWLNTLYSFFCGPSTGTCLSLGQHEEKNFDPKENNELKLLLRNIVEEEKIFRETTIHTFGKGLGLCLIFDSDVSNYFLKFQGKSKEYIDLDSRFNLEKEQMKLLIFNSICHKLSQERIAVDL